MSSSREQIKVQVTMAQTEESFLRTAARDRGGRQEVGLKGLADMLWNAVDHKSRHTRTDTVLALDATVLMIPNPDAVVSDFHLRHGDRTQALGWRAVWIVGPTPANCRLLAGAA